MKNSILFIIMLILFYKAGAQSSVGLEQYYYLVKGEDVSLVTVGYYQNAHDWYGEVRYNYEERKTLSIYAGKTFYGDGRFSYAATPMLGALIGQFNGGALGLNLDVIYKNIELSSQIQYIFSKDDKTRNFFLTWTEASYQVFPFVKAGLAIQQSTVYRSALRMEPGGFMAFSYKNWALPIYVFSPTTKERNYVVGISWEWQHNASNKNHTPAPSLKGRRSLALE